MIKWKHLKRVFILIAYNVFLFKRSSGSPVIINTIPKAGTNLAVGLIGSFGTRKIALKRGFRPWLFKSRGALLHQLSNLRSGCVYNAHLEYSEDIALALRNNEVINIFVKRDLIDLIYSQWFYLKFLDKNHRSYDSSLSDEEMLRDIWFGFGSGSGLKKSYDNYMKWSEIDDVYVVEYRDLVRWKAQNKVPKSLSLIFNNEIVQLPKFFDHFSQTHTFNFAQEYTSNRDRIIKLINTVCT